MNLAAQIKALKPAGRIVLSEENGLRVVAERSGDGRRLRIVRESNKGFSVIRDERF